MSVQSLSIVRRLVYLNALIMGGNVDQLSSI